MLISTLLMLNSSIAATDEIYMPKRWQPIDARYIQLNQPVSTVMQAMFSPQQFANVYFDGDIKQFNQVWRLAKGQNCNEDEILRSSLYCKAFGNEKNKDLAKNEHLNGKLPDLQGMFLRAIDFNQNQEKVDEKINRQAGEPQREGFKKHSHQNSIGGGGDNITAAQPADRISTTNVNQHGTWKRSTTESGGYETRPKNVAAYFYIKIN